MMQCGPQKDSEVDKYSKKSQAEGERGVASMFHPLEPPPLKSRKGKNMTHFGKADP